MLDRQALFATDEPLLGTLSKRTDKMSLITTMGKYCFIQCDAQDCTKKIEHIDPEQVQQLVKLCGWEKIGDQWNCPDCKARRPSKTLPGKRRGRSAPRKEGQSAVR